MKDSLLFFVMIVACLSGCSSSVHPVLTDKDVSHDLDLTGKWQQINVEERGPRIPPFTCEGYDNKSRYDLTFAIKQPRELWNGQKVIPSEYDLAIGKLDGNRYLQVSRAEDSPSFFEGAVTYTFAKFALDDELLLVYPIDDRALGTLLTRTTMAHVNKSAAPVWDVVITEPTGRLQEFLKQHHGDIFVERPLSFRRVGDNADEQIGEPERAAF